MDDIVGTWAFVSSENDEAYAEAEGTPIEVMKKISQVGTTTVYEALGDGRYKCVFTSEATGAIETVFEIGKPVTSKVKFGEEEFEVTFTTNYEGDGNWKSTHTYPGGKVVHETMHVTGDTMKLVYTCNGVSASSISKKVS